MIGMTVEIGRIRGVVDAQTVHPDGKPLVRVKDRWYNVGDVWVVRHGR